MLFLVTVLFSRSAMVVVMGDSPADCNLEVIMGGVTENSMILFHSSRSYRPLTLPQRRTVRLKDQVRPPLGARLSCYLPVILTQHGHAVLFPHCDMNLRRLRKLLTADRDNHSGRP